MAWFATFVTGEKKSLNGKILKPPLETQSHVDCFIKKDSLNSKEGEVKVYTNQTVEYSISYSTLNHDLS